MATDKSFIDFVCDQVSSAGEISNKKMFGEYMVYCNTKPVLVVADNQVFIKMLPQVAELFLSRGINPEIGAPYPGAKDHYILDCEDSCFATEMTALLAQILPVPKPRKK
jgi:hypothetical protein